MWDVYTLENERWYCWHLGGAHSYVKKSRFERNNSLRYSIVFNPATYYDAAGETGGAAPGGLGGPYFEEPDSAGSRHAKTIWADTETVELCIDFPPEPFVVTAPDKFILSPGTRTVFFAALPPVISFNYPASDAFFLDAPFTASKTWWGKDTTKGTLCYSLPRALLSARQTERRRDAINPLFVQCPVIFKNSSRVLQNLDRVMLDTTELSIYEAVPAAASPSGGYLFSDIIEIEILQNEWKINVLTPETYPDVDAWCRSGAERRELSIGAKSPSGKIIRQKGADFIKSITSF